MLGGGYVSFLIFFFKICLDGVSYIDTTGRGMCLCDHADSQSTVCGGLIKKKTKPQNKDKTLKNKWTVC